MTEVQFDTLLTQGYFIVFILAIIAGAVMAK